MADKKRHTPSLQEVNASVDTTKRKGRKFLAYLGPAYLVSVGYMDPGNWATDLAGGSQFGYSLLWVLLMSNMIALLLQSLSARLGLVRGLDLAQASRENYPGFVNISLYILAEIAIAACDLAEVLGMAIGLQLLFGISLTQGVLITVFDTFLLLFLINKGIRKMEAFIMSLVFIIGAAFLVEIFLAKPDPVEMLGGLIPSIPNDTALYIAIGIIGATVMPHNLYLHSSLVQTRKFEKTREAKKKAIKFNIIDSAIALNFAFFVNAAILILAATAFFKNGIFAVAEIQDAHKLLAPMLGSRWAPVLFAIALIAAGQSSTVTGTLAGQIVMEGYLNLRIQPWIRRIITRLIAIIPALITIQVAGEGGTGKLLILSQVILSMQLGFAIIPLIHFVSDRQKMGEFSIRPIVKFLAWICAAIIVGLNIKLVSEEVKDLFMATDIHMVIKILILLIVVFAAILLVYIILFPFIKKNKDAREEVKLPHGTFTTLTSLQVAEYKRIAICLDFSEVDSKAIKHALAQGKSNAHYLLIHVVESAGARVAGKEISDFETETDLHTLHQYTEFLSGLGYTSEIKVGYGSPKTAIPKLVREFNADLLVMGAHGHKGIKDFLYGTTVNSVRHSVHIPVLIV
jgi:manganese transport protein